MKRARPYRVVSSWTDLLSGVDFTQYILFHGFTELWKDPPHVVRTSAIVPELTLPGFNLVAGPTVNEILVTGWRVATQRVEFVKLVDLPLDVTHEGLRVMGLGRPGVVDLPDLMMKMPPSSRLKPSDVQLFYAEMTSLGGMLQDRGIDVAGRPWLRSDSPKAALRGLFRDRSWHDLLEEHPLIMEFAGFIVREDLYAAIERWIDKRYIAVF